MLGSPILRSLDVPFKSLYPKQWMSRIMSFKGKVATQDIVSYSNLLDYNMITH